MDKKIILAVAGSGKTEYLINSIDLNKRTAIVTYTIANQKELKERIIKKFGEIPQSVYLFGFWQFAYNFCLIPLTNKKINGIIFSENYNYLPFYKKKGYFLGNYIMENKICKYLLNENLGYIKRIELFFDEVLIDEIQDFDSYDLDWVFTLRNLNIPVLLVGDYYQKTFSTSNVGNKAQGITKNYNSYTSKFIKNNFHVDTSTLQSSKRCSKEVCEFINTKIGISISSSTNHSSFVGLVDDKNEIEKILSDDNVHKLFYSQHYKYDMKSGNWGGEKGLTFSNVCVILNKNTSKKFISNNLQSLSPQTKAKFYVACTRTASNLYFIDSENIPAYFKIN